MFRIGQKVVAKKTTQLTRKGEIFIVLDADKDCCTDYQIIMIENRYPRPEWDGCTKCGCGDKKEGTWAYSYLFEPLTSFGEEIAERIEREMSEPVEANATLKVWFDMLNEMINEKYSNKQS